MSEQLGYLVLLFVVATCNLLLGFVLAAHVGRLRLDITWFTISITGEQLRETWQSAIAWVLGWVPFLRREAPPQESVAEPAAEQVSGSATAAGPGENHGALHDPAPVAPNPAQEGSADDPSRVTNWREIPVETPAETAEQAAAHRAAPSAEARWGDTPAAPPTEAELQTLRRLAQDSPWPPEVAEAAAAFEATFEEAARPSTETTALPAAAPSRQPAPQPLESLPSFESLAGQLDQELARLCQDMGQVLRTAEAPVAASPRQPEPLPAQSERSVAAEPAETWEAQLESALLENLADLKEAAKLLQAAAATNAVSP